MHPNVELPFFKHAHDFKSFNFCLGCFQGLKSPDWIDENKHHSYHFLAKNGLDPAIHANKQNLKMRAISYLILPF